MDRKKPNTTMPQPITGPHLSIEAARNRFWLKAIVVTIIVCTAVALTVYVVLR